MNTSKRIFLSAITLSLLFSVGAMAIPAAESETLPQLSVHPLPRGEMPPMPPFAPPVYEASMQTNQPAHALSKLIANIPQTADKNYEVRVMARELPPLPSPIEKAAK